MCRAPSRPCCSTPAIRSARSRECPFSRARPGSSPTCSRSRCAPSVSSSLMQARRPSITTESRRPILRQAVTNPGGALQMGGVLKGVRIVEQGTFITGPCAGMMLADLGADVIKVESPEGDPYRNYQGDRYSPHFQAYNRNKRSIALDLKKSTERALFDGLVREADVFIQNFRPGTAARLGAGSDRLRILNPRLVYTSISGFGSTGPYAERPSYDSVAQALSGILSVMVDSDRPRFLGP